MSTSDAQKSEVHTATGDASTSPAAAGDAQTTRGAVDKRHPEGRKSGPGVREADVKIVRDETDDGGPLVIETKDQDEQPPQDRPDDKTDDGR